MYLYAMIDGKSSKRTVYGSLTVGPTAGHLCRVFFALLAGLAPVSTYAAHDSLEGLLNHVKQERIVEAAENAKRDARFLAAREQHSLLLAKVRSELAEEMARGEKLQQAHDLNEQTLMTNADTLMANQGVVGELHGIIRQTAGDIAGVFESSLVSAQFPKRSTFLRHLAESKELPSFEDLEKLWHVMLGEMVQSGEVVKFEAQAINSEGEQQQLTVTRVGTFNAMSDGRFLRYLPETGHLLVPSRQPPPRYQKTAKAFADSTEGVHAVPLDPTRGAMLALLVQKPNLAERIRQGGVVGYIIIVLAVFGLAIALLRYVGLTTVATKIKRQLSSSDADDDNPLGRILKVYTDSPGVDTETLGLKLDEAVLRELPAIQRGLSTLAILAAVAPLLGLLGTVTGIIETFQSITLFGTGDPRLMSGGISQALVTTVLGLVAAIPLLLLHSFLATKSNTVVQVLDEQSAAMVARLAEKRQAAPAV